MKTGDILGIIFLIGAMHFAMVILIKAELKVSANPVDGFLLRWKATRAPVACIVALMIFIYCVYFRGYHLTLDSPGENGETLLIIAGKIFFVTGISLPVMLFNLLNYNKTREIS